VRLEYRFTPSSLTKTPNVTATFNAGQCTLACADANASIYYTAAGAAAIVGFPGPGNPAAIEYDGPFSVASGTMIRAAAYDTNNAIAGSDIWTFTAP